MDLYDASSFFSDDPVYDGYTGAFLFNAQVGSFNDSHSDGATNRRRVLNLGPTDVMPARRVIQMYNDRWIVGVGTSEGFQGSIIRQYFTMKRATDLFAILTPAQAIAAAAGTQAYGHKFYFRDTPAPLTDSDVDSFWNIFLPPSEAVGKGSLLRDANGRLYRARGDYLPVEGLHVLQADTLDASSIMTAQFNVGTFDPVSDAYQGTTVSMSVLAMDPAKFYHHQHVSDPTIAKGDLAVFVPNTATVKVNMMFTMNSRNWRVLAIVAEQDCWALHARLA